MFETEYVPVVEFRSLMETPSISIVIVPDIKGECYWIGVMVNVPAASYLIDVKLFLLFVPERNLEIDARHLNSTAKAELAVTAPVAS